MADTQKNVDVDFDTINAHFNDGENTSSNTSNLHVNSDEREIFNRMNYQANKVIFTSQTIRTPITTLEEVDFCSNVSVTGSHSISIDNRTMLTRDNVKTPYLYTNSIGVFSSYTNNVYFLNDIDATSHKIYTKDLTVSDNVIEENLTVNNSATVPKIISDVEIATTVDDTTITNHNLIVSGNITSNNNLTVNNDLIVNNNLTISNNASIPKIISDVEIAATIDGTTTTNHNLAVSGNINTNNLTISGTTNTNNLNIKDGYINVCNTSTDKIYSIINMQLDGIELQKYLELKDLQNKFRYSTWDPYYLYMWYGAYNGDTQNKGRIKSTANFKFNAGCQLAFSDIGSLTVATAYSAKRGIYLYSELTKDSYFTGSNRSLIPTPSANTSTFNNIIDVIASNNVWGNIPLVYNDSSTSRKLFSVPTDGFINNSSQISISKIVSTDGFGGQYNYNLTSNLYTHNFASNAYNLVSNTSNTYYNPSFKEYTTNEDLKTILDISSKETNDSGFIYNCVTQGEEAYHSIPGGFSTTLQGQFAFGRLIGYRNKNKNYFTCLEQPQDGDMIYVIDNNNKIYIGGIIKDNNIIFMFGDVDSAQDNKLYNILISEFLSNEYFGENLDCAIVTYRA